MSDIQLQHGKTKEECLLGENHKPPKISATLWGMKRAISPLGSG
jgi:hypothetical protein